MAFADFDRNSAVGELNAAVSVFGETVDFKFVLAFQESTFAELIPQAFLESIVDESLKCPAFVWKATLSGLLASELIVAARRCHAPALLIWGDRDAFVPYADQLAFRSAMPASRLVTLKGVGHAPHWERPNETASILRAFLAELEEPAAGHAAS